MASNNLFNAVRASYALVGCLASFLSAIQVMAEEPLEDAPRPPNIVFILTDDQRYDALGVVDPTLDTPNLDAIARTGVQFTNAFVSTALCSPSRATILTGQYMNRHGIVDNNKAIPKGTVFFPQYLQQAGFETAFIGKWHMGGEHDDPQPGFDHWISFAGQGNYHPIDAKGRQSMLNINGEHVPQEGYITDELTDYALEWLNGLSHEKPFFLYLSHKAVHSEFIPAARHESQYADLPIELPESAAPTAENREGKPMWVWNQRNSWHGVDYPYHTDLDITEYKRSYLRTLSAVDDGVGEVLSWLRDNDLESSTVVIFMSDNGFLFGEHGLIDKRHAYEESMRVPLLVKGPGIASGVVRPQVVANLDIAPTILEFANLESPTHFQGSSFVPLTRSNPDASAWRSELIYEYFWEYNFPQTPTTFAIRTDQYKYIQYHGIWDTDELYDIQSDPKESTNLIDDPEYAEIIVELRDRLYEARLGEDGRSAVPFNNKKGPVFRRRDGNGSRAAEFPASWIND